jgi:hypothetical protein
LKATNIPFLFFGGTEFNRVKDPLRPNNNVALFTNTAGSAFEGAFIDLQNGIVLDSSKKLYFSLYHAQGDSFTFHIKLEQSTVNEPEVYIQKTFKTSTWHTDSFDFSKAKVVGSDAPINAKGTYKRLTLFSSKPTNSNRAPITSTTLKALFVPGEANRTPALLITANWFGPMSLIIRENPKPKTGIHKSFLPITAAGSMAKSNILPISSTTRM